jgi:Uma2 family endonuclease
VSAVTTEFTLADLERMPEDGMHREILYGELIELPPPKLRHEEIASHFLASLNVFNSRSKLGRVYGSSMGYKVLGDVRTWIEPDVSFLLMQRVQANKGKDYADGAPDLAIEIISPSESAQDVEAKTDAYFRGGAHAVVVVYPKPRIVRLHLSDGSARTLRAGDVLTIPELLPGWELPIEDIFAD